MAASSCHSVLHYLLSLWMLQDVSLDYIIRHKLIETELLDTIAFSQMNAAVEVLKFHPLTSQLSREAKGSVQARTDH